MKINGAHLLVDSEEFMDDLEQRILEATNRVLIQVMTFEADQVGMRLYRALKKSSAQEKIMCVDAYSLANINDGWAFGLRYLTSLAHRREVDATRKILKSSNEFGIHVVITNRLGTLGLNYPFRNHKKIIVVDDVVYLGGINFSDHNFAWHDFMVRMSDQEIVKTLVEDFEITCQKKNQSAIKKLDAGRLYFLNGANSKKEYIDLFNQILKVQRSITILSPYISDPLLRKLNKLNESIEVNIITPNQNNKPLMKRGLYGKVRKLNFKLYEYAGGMSHLKAMLVDGTKLVFGSSNFDVVSYYLEQEVVMISEDPELIAQFKRRIQEPAIRQSHLLNVNTLSRYWCSQLAMIFLKKIVKLLAFFRPS